MGATTIWERWNSVLPDGKISSEGMNSLNHYTYGSIAEWMYRYMAGISPVEDRPGFRHIKLTPMPDYHLRYAKATYNSTATLVLPDAKLENVKVNGKLLKDTHQLFCIHKISNII